MTEIVAARYGFGWGWDVGESGWKPGADQNFRMNDVFTGLSVINDSLTAPPGSPADGDIYIPAATATGAWATHEGKIAAYQAGTWYFYSVVTGLRALFVNHSDLRFYDGSAWTKETGYTKLPSEVQNIPITFPFVDRPLDGQKVFVPIVQDTDVPANFAGTVGYSNTLATASAVLTFSRIRAGVSVDIGTVTFTSGSSAPTLSTQALAHLLTNDIAYVTAPSPRDTTLADFSITFLFKKV